MKSIDMYTYHDTAKRVKEASAMLSFHCSPRDGGVSHVLVLVFAATRRNLALQSARVVEHAAAAMLLFCQYSSL